MSIADRLYARCGEPVNLEKRTDTASGVGTIIESYTAFATALMAKVVEVGTLHAGTEQVEEGATHLITIKNFVGAEDAEYVTYGIRRMRVQRMRLIGPPDIRFMQYLCEEIEKNA
jgi:hypothetical protein